MSRSEIIANIRRALGIDKIVQIFAQTNHKDARVEGVSQVKHYESVLANLALTV